MWGDFVILAQKNGEKVRKSGWMLGQTKSLTGDGGLQVIADQQSVYLAKDDSDREDYEIESCLPLLCFLLLYSIW